MFHAKFPEREVRKKFSQLRMLHISVRYSSIGLEAQKFCALLNINAEPFFIYIPGSFFLFL